MNPEQAQTLRSILSAQQVAALGTLHEGVPYVSMVPFALLRDGSAVIHVSALAAHTRAMLAEPAVSLLVMAPPSAGVLPQALPRVTTRRGARRLPRALCRQRADVFLRRLLAVRPRAAVVAPGGGLCAGAHARADGSCRGVAVIRARCP